MPRESTIQRNIQKLVRDRGGYALKVHGSEMQPAAVDLYICYRGWFIAVETKVPGEKLTPMQRHILKDVNEAEGFGIWATQVRTVEILLDAIDESQDDPAVINDREFLLSHVPQS